MVRRNKYNKIGRPKKAFPLAKYDYKRLGGIPMTIKNGKVQYRSKVPRAYGKTKDGAYYDDESIEREQAILPTGLGSFVRRHVYEMRYAIGEKTLDEIRKEEYLKWWNKQNI
jgi:hypothetical protein